MSGAALNFNASSGLDDKKRVNEALRAAAIQGDVGRIQRQLDEGADIEYPDVNKLTPLYFAATGLHFEATKFLLGKGARVDGGINASLPDTALIQTSGSEEGLEMAKLLLSHQADINARNHAGRTALHEALLYEREDAALYLIEQGADVNIPDKDGIAPIATAVKMKLRAAALSLVNHGADITTPQLFGTSIRENAQRKGWGDVVEAIDAALRRPEEERLRAQAEKQERFEAELDAAPVLQHRMPVGRPIVLKSH